MRNEMEKKLRAWRLERFPDIGLGAKMAVLVVIGTLSLIGLFAYLGTAALSENIQRTLQERVTLAQATASHIDYVLASIEHILTDTAVQDGWADPERIPNALEQAYHRLSFYGTHVFFLDRSGRMIAAHPPITSTVSFSSFASVSAVLDGQPFAVSRYKRPLNPSYSSTIATAPVRDASGQVIGALVVTIDLAGANVRTFSHPIGLGETGYMDLVDLSGTILVSTRPGRIGSTSDHGESLAGMIREQRQAVSACHDCHTSSAEPAPLREVLAFAPLARAQWGVAVRQSEDEVFAATRLLQIRIFALMVICLIGALMLVYVTTRSVITPVQTLTTATQRIAAGDLDTPIEARGDDEIGTLARSFDVMRERVKNSMAEIQAWNRELDTRVQELTAECNMAKEQIERLYTELQRKEQGRTELLRRVFSAQEEERKRISRELHDETCQILTGLSYALDDAAETTNAPEIQPLLERMHALAATALEEVNRIILDLRPTMLDHLGLVPALRWYAEARFNGRDIRLTIHETGRARRLPPQIESALFRVGQEAINNIAKHSGARHATFDFDFMADQIEVMISDDGNGFDTAGVAASGSRRALGLIGMQERMSAVGGEFHLQSTPGAGTVIRLSVCLDRSDDDKNRQPI